MNRCITSILQRSNTSLRFSTLQCHNNNIYKSISSRSNNSQRSSSSSSFSIVSHNNNNNNNNTRIQCNLNVGSCARYFGSGVGGIGFSTLNRNNNNNNSGDNKSQEVIKMMGQVDQFVLMGQYDDALALCDRILRIDSEYIITIHLAKAKILLNHYGDFEKALEECNKAHAAKSRFESSCHKSLTFNIDLMKLHVLVPQGNIKAASLLSLAIIDQHPDKIDAPFLRSASLACNGAQDYQSCHKILMLMKNRFPNEFTPIESILLGVTEFNLGMYDDSLKSVNIGLSSCPASEYKNSPQKQFFIDALVVKVVILQDKLQEQIDTLKILIELQPDFINAYKLCSNLSQQDRFEEAYKYAELSLKCWDDESSKYIDQSTKEGFLLHIGTVQTKALQTMNIDISLSSKEVAQILERSLKIIEKYNQQQIYGERCVNFLSNTINYYINKFDLNSVEMSDFFSGLAAKDRSLITKTFKSEIQSSEQLNTLNEIKSNSIALQSIINQFLENNKNNLQVDRLAKLFKCIEVLAGLYLTANDIKFTNILVYHYNCVIYKMEIREINQYQYHKSHAPFNAIAWEFDSLPKTKEEFVNHFYEDKIPDIETLKDAIAICNKNIESVGTSIYYAMRAFFLFHESDKIVLHTALSLVNQAVQIDKYHDIEERIMVRIITAYFLIRTYSFKEALDLSKQIYGLYPNNDAVCMSHAQTLVVNNEFKAAQEVLNTYIERLNNNDSMNTQDKTIKLVNAINRLGYIQLYVGDGEKATEYFNSIYKQGLAAPTSKSTSNYFTRHGLFEAKLKIMIKDLNEVLEKNPIEVLSLFTRSLLNIGLAKKDEVIRDMLKIQSIATEHPILLEDPTFKSILTSTNKMSEDIKKTDIKHTQIEMRTLLLQYYSLMVNIATHFMEGKNRQHYYQQQHDDLTFSLSIEEKMANYSLEYPSIKDILNKNE
ncbi:hypothetical protein PPL_00642 [Heterostelium album PN500]|uniref:Uncharacterized protein n=1 Tax=Heterostelium pallidum (strain ATCC 26659 / Pp 5 / PN500) TaxID=670386 RepID=D3AX14_HETP5|nr:hypothetical protein PPL_00642 [Heterostelium album PN500]EFA86837.1 hypothetical protein PPL_00642 [Heterostelium album PN500]|eukprot:XP_020438940.1 hypothetical protein PPL_00642 [Heterostelium album PN500]